MLRQTIMDELQRQRDIIKRRKAAHRPDVSAYSLWFFYDAAEYAGADLIVLAYSEAEGLLKFEEYVWHFARHAQTGEPISVILDAIERSVSIRRSISRHSRRSGAKCA